MAQPRKNYGDFTQLVTNITYPGFKYTVEEHNFPHAHGEAGYVTEYYLRIVCDGVDNRSGEPYEWKSRKWRLSPFMTDMEVIQTALKATLTALEHEARENFKFMGTSIFDPHYDLWQLLRFRRQQHAITGRQGPDE